MLCQSPWTTELDHADAVGCVLLRKQDNNRRCCCCCCVDLSRNQFTEVPADICNCGSMERLNCYHNVVKSLPVAIVQLQNLVYLNLR